jgi:hypothetical protein
MNEMAPVIGDVQPRAACPYCKTPKPTALGIDAFPPEAREEVLQALFDGASFYRCEGCSKQWAVVRKTEHRKSMKRAAHLDGVGNRRERRKAAALARRRLS